MHEWVLQAERIFDGSWSSTPEEVTNAAVGEHLDRWLEQLQTYLSTLEPSGQVYQGLEPLAQTLVHLRPHLVCCYDVENFPRTNNELERCIRRLKTQYRRISGRKNWNAYLLRYGRCVAYAAWWEQDAAHRLLLEHRTAQIDRARWRQLRQETTAAQSEQLKRFRFCHRRLAYLNSLEQRWEDVAPTQPLP